MCSGPHMGARAPWQEMGQHNAGPDIILTSGPWWSPVLHPSECSGQLLERPWVHVVSLEYPDKLKPLKQQHMFMIIELLTLPIPVYKYAVKGKEREWKLHGSVHVEDPKGPDLEMKGQRRASQNGLHQYLCLVCLFILIPLRSWTCKPSSICHLRGGIFLKFPDYHHPSYKWQRHLKLHPTWELWALIVRLWKLLGY